MYSKRLLISAAHLRYIKDLLPLVKQIGHARLQWLALLQH